MPDLEEQLQPEAIGENLFLLDLHVELDDLRTDESIGRLLGGGNCLFGCIFP